MKKLFTLTISCVAIILFTFTAISADTISTVSPTPPAIITPVQSPVEAFVLPIIKTTGKYRATVRIPIKTEPGWPARVTFLRPNNKNPYTMELKYDAAGDFYYVDMLFSRDGTGWFDFYNEYGTWEILNVMVHVKDDNMEHYYVNQKYYAANLPRYIPVDFDLYKFNVQNLNGKVVDYSNLTYNKILSKTVGDKTELKKAWVSTNYQYIGDRTIIYFDIKDTSGILSGKIKLRDSGYKISEYDLVINPRRGYAYLDFTLGPDSTGYKFISYLNVYSVSFTDMLGNITTFNAKSKFPPIEENETDFTNCFIKIRGTDGSYVRGMKMSKTSIKLKAKQDLRLIAAAIPTHTLDVTIVWRSSNPKVATVTRTGHVTAIKPGTAYITAYPYLGYGYGRCKVVVIK